MIKCGVVLGTNALSSLGFNITHQSGVVIQPITESENSSKAKGTDTSQQSIKEAKDDLEKDNSVKSDKDKESGHNKETITHLADDQSDNPIVGEVVLRKDLSLGPGQTRLVQVEIINGKNIKSNMLKIISPNEVVLAENMCDFTKELWGCEALPDIEVTNWGDNTITLDKGTRIEEVTLVKQEDPVWNDFAGSAAVLILKDEELKSRQEKLREQLTVGELSEGEKQILLKLLSAQHQVFALTDSELGQTDLVEHNIKVTDNIPVVTSSEATVCLAC